MNKTKGLVMRTSRKVTAIFTEKGDFLEIPTPKEPPVIGQTIEVNLNPRRIIVFNNSILKYTSVAAVLFLALSISVFFLLIPNMAVASVALDINKGVELLINKEGKIIKVKDVNGGSSIAEGLSIEGLDVYRAVNLILEEANQRGTFNETHNLILASIVPVNKWGTHIMDTEKLRTSIRDEMTRRNMSGSVVVSQANEKIQQEAKQQGMTVNSYLIYDRCEEKGITIQPDTLRNDAQKALVDAKVSVSTLFPEESFEVRSQDGKGKPGNPSNTNHSDDSDDTKREPNLKHGPEYEPPSNMESNTTENHNSKDSSKTGETAHENETTQHTTPAAPTGETGHENETTQHTTPPTPTGETGHESETTQHTTPPAPTGETGHENETTQQAVPPVTQPAPTGESSHENETTQQAVSPVTQPAPTGEIDH